MEKFLFCGKKVKLDERRKILSFVTKYVEKNHFSLEKQRQMIFDFPHDKLEKILISHFAGSELRKYYQFPMKRVRIFLISLPVGLCSQPFSYIFMI